MEATTRPPIQRSNEDSDDLWVSGEDEDDEEGTTGWDDEL